MGQVQVGGQHWQRGGGADQTLSAALQTRLLERKKVILGVDKTFLVCKKRTKPEAKMEFSILTLQEQPVGQVGLMLQEI